MLVERTAPEAGMDKWKSICIDGHAGFVNTLCGIVIMIVMTMATMGSSLKLYARSFHAAMG